MARCPYIRRLNVKSGQVEGQTVRDSLLSMEPSNPRRANYSVDQMTGAVVALESSHVQRRLR